MTLKQIKQTLEDAESLMLVTQALSEVSSVKLKKIRKSVEQNQVFFDELSLVYHMVKTIATERGLNIEKNGKTACILITSNFKFYGDLNKNVTTFFVENAQKLGSDNFVVGQTGIDYIYTSGSKLLHKGYTFQKDPPSGEELKQLVSVVQNYSRVLVFYPRFKTVLTQVPHVRDITQSSLPKASRPLDETLNIFEPELEKVLNFFDTQITTILFDGCFLEAELARVAARMVFASQAEDNANKYIGEEKAILANTMRSYKNSLVLESLSSYMSAKRNMVR